MWAQRASRIRWNPVRAARGLPLLPVPDIDLVDTLEAAELRLRRALAHRMCEYDGVPYDDRLASDPRVFAALADEIAALRATRQPRGRA